MDANSALDDLVSFGPEGFEEIVVHIGPYQPLAGR
jgi:hypothetical protein